MVSKKEIQKEEFIEKKEVLDKPIKRIAFVWQVQSLFFVSENKKSAKT